MISIMGTMILNYTNQTVLPRKILRTSERFSVVAVVNTGAVVNSIMTNALNAAITATPANLINT